MDSKFYRLVAVCFSVIFILQPTSSMPAQKESQEQGDEYARKAAEALDSTLLSFKEGLNNLIEDGKLFSNMMSKLANDIINMAPQGKVVNTEESRQRLLELTERANKTLSERLLKMDDV